MTWVAMHIDALKFRTYVVSTTSLSARWKALLSTGWRRGAVSHYRNSDFARLILKGNDTVQIHFYYSYKLRIFFHTIRFVHHKMKDAKKLGASIELRNKVLKVGGYSRILTCSSMGMNRHTDIKKMVFKKQAWKVTIINVENCSKYISLSICVKKLFFNELIFMLLRKIWRILSKFYENLRKELQILWQILSLTTIFANLCAM